MTLWEIDRAFYRLTLAEIDSPMATRPLVLSPLAGEAVRGAWCACNDHDSPAVCRCEKASGT